MEAMIATISVEANESHDISSDPSLDEKVAHYTDFFLKLADPDGIFQPFQSKIPVKSPSVSLIF